jgi:fructose/tagatose bisphosphate aldolase
MIKQNMDQLARQLGFGTESEKEAAFIKIWNTGQKVGVYPASIHDFYVARGREALPVDFTVPAINLRGMTYDMARAVFRVADKKNVGALILELARSEMGYTDQPPHEYAGVVMAAAIREGFRGPLFIQGDHFQLKVSKKGKTKQSELEEIKKLIKEAIDAGFYNIDIDASTLVDYSVDKVSLQQQENILVSAELANFIRSLEPEGITISLGGEIGHIGGKNSTEAELRAYMDGFNNHLQNGYPSLAKVSIQTGTHHGGVVLPDGTLADVSVAFDTLKNLARVAREYGMGGTVQHGASTLPDDYFAQFPQSEAVEVHLATGFQNIMMDHPAFPNKLLDKMYAYLDQKYQSQRDKEKTDQQFHYKLRKTAWGEFKKQAWEIKEEKKQRIRAALEDRFEFIFKELNVFDTKKMVEENIEPVKIIKEKINKENTDLQNSQGLAD